MVQKIGIGIEITGLSIALVDLAVNILEPLGVKMPYLLPYILLSLAGLMLIGGWVFVFWDWLKHLFGAYTFQISFKKKAARAPANHAQADDIAGWLEKVVNEDLESLRSGTGERRIHCLMKRADYSGIIKSEPFMQLDLLILNSAVFPLYVEGIKGKITIEDEPCQRDVEWIKEKNKETLEIKHAEWHWLYIKQVFTTKERADEIRSAGQQKQHLRINLNECSVVVRPYIQGKQMEALTVSLGNNIETIEWKEPSR